MATRKWSDELAKLSPERQETIRKGVAEDLADIDAKHTPGDAQVWIDGQPTTLRRIKAVLAACQGISTEALEAGVVRVAMSSLDELKKWNADMPKKKVVPFCVCGHNDIAHAAPGKSTACCACNCQEYRAALAKLEWK